MKNLSRRKFNRLAAICGLWPLAAETAQTTAADQEWCLQQEMGILEAQIRLMSIQKQYRLDDGPRGGLHQEILIAPPSALASKPDNKDGDALGFAWAIERLGREFGRKFREKHGETVPRILWQFFGHRKVRIAWIERNLLSIPDWLLHCLLKHVKFTEGALRRERSGPLGQLASKSISFGHGDDALKVGLAGIELGHLPGNERHLRLYQQAIPREYSGPGLRRHEYVENRFFVMKVDEHVRRRVGDVDFHMIPAEEPSFSEETGVWDMRFITLGQIRDDGMCAMLGLGFRPDDAALVSIRPCFLPFSVAAISIPGLIPMLNKAEPVN